MGIYSIRGSSLFDEHLNRDFRLVAQSLENSELASLCRALILIGGYGRGEGTPLIVDGRETPFNDYDFVVVSAPMNRRRRNVIQKRLRQMERDLSKDIGLPVDLQLYPANTLPRCEFSMLNYEMKYGHKVVWGDSDVLQAMPDYPHGRIPLSEGTRLLLNRGKLLLDIRRALRSGKELNAEDKLRYVKFIFKAVLAFGDCALLMSKSYDLSYAVKKERIEIMGSSDVPDAAFMIKRYKEAIEVKEWGDYSFLQDYMLPDEFEIIRKYYIRFFQWYESARARTDASATSSGVNKEELSPDRAPAWKNVVFNTLSFGTAALNSGSDLWRTHPRSRLYSSLIYLLSDEPVDSPRAARQLLLPESAELAEIEERFYQLHRRFS